MSDRAKPQPGLGRLQDLIGNARNIYANDRSADRADRLVPILDEAFDIVVRLRSRAWVRKQRKDASK